MLEIMFKAAHVVAVVGWLALFLAPTRVPLLIATARFISALLAAGYTILFVIWSRDVAVLTTDYTLRGVGAFFDNSALRLLGWVHYLAFDLLVGTWEAEEANSIGLSHGVLLFCLMLTFLVGPIGLLTFWLFRAARRRADTSAARGY